MRLNSRRGWMLTLTASVLALTPAALATSAGARGRTLSTCTRHQGQTAAQNRLVRLFRFRGQLYACAGVHGRSYRLRTGPGSQTPQPGIELAGRYVAWRELDTPHGEQSDNIYRLNAVTGARDLIASVQLVGHESHGDFVLNAHGTVVWIHIYAACLGANHCVVHDTVLQSNNNGGKVLDDATNSSTPNSQQAPSPPIPAGSLGLSQDGTTAYWIDNGHPRSAVIP